MTDIRTILLLLASTVLVPAVAAVQMHAALPADAPRVLGRAVEALKVGPERAPSVWIVDGTGRENLTAELQGIRSDAPTWRLHRESVVIDERSDTVGWQRTTPRNDGSVRDRRFVYAPDRTGVMDHAAGTIRVRAGGVTLAERRALMRRVPHLLIADAWRHRGTARLTTAVSVNGQPADELTVVVPDDGPLTLVIGRSPAVVHEVRYPVHFPGRGPTVVRWRWDGWSPDASLGYVPSGHVITIGDHVFQEVRYARFEGGRASDDRFLDPMPAGSRAPDAGRPSWAAAAGPATGEVAPGVHVARVDGFTVMFVELQDGIVAFEAPEPFFGSEAIPALRRRAGGTLTPRILAQIRQTIPGKPIRHVVISHHHGDHLGGIGAFVEAGAVPIVPAPDLDAARQALGHEDVSVHGVERAHVISDGTRRIEVLNVGPNPHSAGNLVLWLPSERILIQGDLFYFAAGAGFHNGRERMNRFFAEWLKARGLEPRMIYGVHNNGAAGPAAIEAALALPSEPRTGRTAGNSKQSLGWPAALVNARFASFTTEVELRTIANAGVLVSKDGGRVLIDAPIREGISPYATSDAGERERLEAAVPPYDRVDAILITHWHEDHFSAEAVAAHLLANPRAVLISSPEVVDRVRAVAPDLPAGRSRGVLPPPGGFERVMVGRLAVRVLRLRHNPARRFPEQHLGFLLGDTDAILHTGDADPRPDNFSLMRGLPRVDLALVPSWYVLSPENRRFVCDVIAPARLAAMHVPPRDAPDVAERLAQAGLRITVLGTPATDVRLRTAANSGPLACESPAPVAAGSVSSLR